MPSDCCRCPCEHKAQGSCSPGDHHILCPLQVGVLEAMSASSVFQKLLGWTLAGKPALKSQGSLQ